MAGFSTSDGLGETENGYDVIYSVNKIIEVINTGYSQAGFLVNSVTGSRYVETGLGGGKAYYRMRVDDAWVDMFVMDIATKTISLGTSINVSGSAPVKSVNKVTGSVLVHQMYTSPTPAISPAVDTIIIDAYDGVAPKGAGVGALVENINGTTTNLNSLPNRSGYIAYDTSKNRFVGRHNTGWKYLDGTDGEALTYKDTTGFTAAGRVAVANAAGKVLKETGYIIPTTVGASGTVLTSDGTNVTFSVPRGTLVNLSGSFTVDINWTLGHTFYLPITSNITFTYTALSAQEGQTIMIVVLNNAATGLTVDLPSSKWIMAQPIRDIGPGTATVYTVIRIANTYWVVSTRDLK